MAQRISRAKRTLRGRRLDQPGDLSVVLCVLYLVHTVGHAGWRVALSSPCRLHGVRRSYRGVLS